MKAIELLKDYKNIDFGCNVEELHNEIDEAISEIHMLLMYKYLADTYLKIEKCKCGTLKVRGYLCPNRKCTEDE
jgi:hypothetical protein